MDLMTALSAVAKNWETVVTVAGVTAGAGSYAISMHQKLSKMLKSLDKVEGLSEQVAAIKAELSPNGGGSLKDAVNSIRTEVKRAAYKNTLLTNYDPYPIIECDHTGACIWINKYGIDFLGLTNTDYKNFGWLSGLHHTRDNLRVEWHAAIQTGSSWVYEAMTNNHAVLIDMQCLREGPVVVGWFGTITKKI